MQAAEERNEKEEYLYEGMMMHGDFRNSLKKYTELLQIICLLGKNDLIQSLTVDPCLKKHVKLNKYTFSLPSFSNKVFIYNRSPVDLLSIQTIVLFVRTFIIWLKKQKFTFLTAGWP